MKATSRCEADLERRKRAYEDAALVSRHGEMEQRICFEVGYDHRDFGCDHGRHGMQLRFVLTGPSGAVQWLAFLSNWTPGNVHFGDVQAEGGTSLVAANPRIGDGSAADLGFHAREPQYEGQDGPTPDCEYLGGDACYYDGSGLNAEPLLAAFLDHGPMAVWAALARYYQSLFGPCERAS